MYHSFLLIDSEFQSLNIPLQPEDRRKLEKVVSKFKAVQPIPTWNRYVLDCYETYDLCEKIHRMFPTTEITFPTRQHAIAWICRRQLERDDLVKNARIWIFYRLYRAEKNMAKAAESKDYFQYRKLSPSTHVTEPMITPERYPTVLIRLANEYKLHPDTLTRYCSFGKKIDLLENLYPGVRTRLLTGNLDLFQKDINGLLRMPREQLREMIENPRCRKLVQKDLEKPVKHRQPKIRLETAIKQTPSYDPDAVLNGLSYTVATWKKTISQTMEKPALHTASITGKRQLRAILRELTAEINKLTYQLEETPNERILEPDRTPAQLHP